MDRRSQERLPLNYFAACNTSSFRAGIESITNDISLKGACILTERKLKPEKKIKLKLYLGPKIGSKDISAKVIYSKPLESSLGKGYLSGLEFSNLILNDKRELLENEY